MVIILQIYNLIDRVWFFIENLYDSCIPYTEEACTAAGMNLGLEIGSDFNAGPSTNKGCYAYNNKNGAHGGKVFFGASDNTDELAAPIKEEDQFRPIGHDCKSNIHLILSTIILHC